jgi:hypothetical protein
VFDSSRSHVHCELYFDVAGSIEESPSFLATQVECVSFKVSTAADQFLEIAIFVDKYPGCLSPALSIWQALHDLRRSVTGLSPPAGNGANLAPIRSPCRGIIRRAVNRSLSADHLFHPTACALRNISGVFCRLLTGPCGSVELERSPVRGWIAGPERGQICGLLTTTTCSPGKVSSNTRNLVNARQQIGCNPLQLRRHQRTPLYLIRIALAALRSDLQSLGCLFNRFTSRIEELADIGISLRC